MNADLLEDAVDANHVSPGAVTNSIGAIHGEGKAKVFLMRVAGSFSRKKPGGKNNCDCRTIGIPAQTAHNNLKVRDRVKCHQ